MNITAAKNLPDSTIWYYVSDLMGWRYPHLTGIQRTIVFMLNGFHEMGIEPQLVRFNPGRFRFEKLDPTELPIQVRRYLTRTQEEAAIQDATEGKDASLSMRDRIRNRAGQHPMSKEAFESLLDFIRSGKNLSKKTGNWLKSKFPQVTGNDPEQTTPCGFPAPAFSDEQGTPCILISLSASWGIKRHNEALYSLKKQGFFIVRMIYDMIPSLKPHYVTQKESSQFDIWVNEVFQHASLLLAISEYTKKEIHRYCSLREITPPQVRVVRLGDVLDVSKSGGDSKSESQDNCPDFIPKRPFFIFVCTFHVRKNQRLAYDAWRIMLEQDRDQWPDLVFIGLTHPIVANLIDEINRDVDVQGHVHILSNVSDHDLKWYYQHCKATTYPSFYEGWGLPVAESLAYGKVCIASHTTSIPEISDLPEFIDPFNVYELVAKVQRCMNDPGWLKEKEALIKERFVQTEWTHTTAQTLHYLYHDLLTRP
jgi:glycosyltransferase involved in cell wall biosynthesis